MNSRSSDPHELVQRRKISAHKQRSSILENFSNILPGLKYKNQQIHEGECYLKSQSEKYKAHWVAMIGNELFWYKDSTK
jgi:hypothetical protein